jgi:hypothetical protein
MRQSISMNKKLKKNMTITKKEHDEWHKKHGYSNKSSKEHDLCHKRVGIKVKP